MDDLAALVFSTNEALRKQRQCIIQASYHKGVYHVQTREHFVPEFPGRQLICEEKFCLHVISKIEHLLKLSEKYPAGYVKECSMFGR